MQLYVDTYHIYHISKFFFHFGGVIQQTRTRQHSAISFSLTDDSLIPLFSLCSKQKIRIQYHPNEATVLVLCPKQRYRQDSPLSCPIVSSAKTKNGREGKKESVCVNVFFVFLAFVHFMRKRWIVVQVGG